MPHLGPNPLPWRPGRGWRRLAWRMLWLGTAMGSVWLARPPAPGAAQEPATVAAESHSLSAGLEPAQGRLAVALREADEEAIRQAVAKLGELLGDQAGVPEVPDTHEPVPAAVFPLQPEELARAYDASIRLIERRKWWSIGLDPTAIKRPLREPAGVIEGCLAARKGIPDRADQLLAMARDAGDFLIWAQNQAGTGVVPFPAVRGGTSPAFAASEQVLKRAEKDGRLAPMMRSGWLIDDALDGGLQFDNGLGGVALIHLHEATGDNSYRQAAIAAADWAATRPLVPNWNYNSFSVYLLAEVHRLTGNQKYLALAVTKARLGVLPGQLTSGPRAGRWADPHNARPAYHYIMVRALAALAAVMPADAPELPAIVAAIRLALLARNPDFQQGASNAESAMEALLLVDRLPPHVAVSLMHCQTDEALATLERFAVGGFRAGRNPLGPGAWGQWLEHARRRGW